MTTQIEMSLDSETWIERAHYSLTRSDDWRTGFEFSADYLHGVLTPPNHPNAYGALVNAMAYQGIIEHVGYQKSQRQGRNGSLIRKWRVR